ncbi:MAG: hypothetical protein PHF57_08785 [Methanoregula sp.]|jgi:hypothetical protein|nr:hypothetical protein [Methanoregula sp.]
METETLVQPIAKVAGIYRGTASGLTPLTPESPRSPEEVRRNPIFYPLRTGSVWHTMVMAFPGFGLHYFLIIG